MTVTRYRLISAARLPRWQHEALTGLLDEPDAELVARTDAAEWPEGSGVEQLVELPEAAREAPLWQEDIDADVSLMLAPGTPSEQSVVWHFHLGDACRYAASPPYFWELHDGDPTLAISLLGSHNGAQRLLYRGSVRRISDDAAGSHQLVLTVAGDFLAKAHRDRALGVEAPVVEVPVPRAVKPWHRGIAALRRLRGKLHAKAEWLFRHEQWGVGIVDAPIETLLRAERCPPARWIPNEDRERFIADPAGVDEGTHTGVFVEDLEQRQYRGKVTYYRYHPDTGFAGPEDVLVEGHHLSYPYIIEHDGRRFCVPESAAADEVALYELTDYPRGWTKVATLLAGYKALDSTLFEHDGRWWMLSATRVASGAYSLVAHYANDLFGPWQPHPLNPLSTDIATARPGGKPFYASGALIRPAQDCSETYGGALALMRIDRLTPSAFAETRIRVLRPDPKSPYPHGFHTAYGVGERTLVDGKRFILIPYVLRKALGLEPS